MAAFWRIPGGGARRWSRLLAAGASGLALASAVTPAAVAGAPRPASAAGTITTVAGGAGGPGPATSVAVSPCGIRVAGGSLYVGDAYSVRKISTSTGRLTTVAGNGALLVGGRDGDPATKAAIYQACGSAVDQAGNLLFTEDWRVRVVAARTGTFYGQAMTAGGIYTLAGTGLNQAAGVALDAAGNVVIADAGSPDCGTDCPAVGALVRVFAVRTGTFYGQQMTAGGTYTVAGTLNGPGPEGNTGPAAGAWLGTTIGAVRLDGGGNLVIPDGGENDFATTIAPTVRVVAVRTGTFYGQAMTAGHIYRVAGNGQAGTGGNGGPALSAPLSLAGGVAVDSSGNLVIADGSRARVVAVRTGTFYRKAMTAGDIYGIAGLAAAGYSGDGGPAVQAHVTASAVAVDSSGNVVLGGGSRVRVVAVKTGTFYGKAMTAGGIYTAAGNGTGYSGDRGPALRAMLGFPSGVAADPSGDLVTADGLHNVAWVVMARSGQFFGRNVTAGNAYRIVGTGTSGYAGDGGPARKATFSIEGEGPAVTFDSGGNVLVADANNERVRVIAATTGTFYGRPMTAGYVYTIAGTGTCGFSGDGGPAVQARLCYPAGVSTDHAGNILITDGINRRVRVLAVKTGTFYGRSMTAGDIYTIAGNGNYKYSGDGGPAVQAGMSPMGTAVDPAGNVVITDADGNQRLRLVVVKTGTFYGRSMTAGDIYTIAGNGTYGFSGNGGPATAAELERPLAATVDGSGNVVFTDAAAMVTWVVAVKTGTFYGVPMTAGDIYVVAGNGSALGTDGLGDGGPATSAVLDTPDGLAIDPAGNLLVADLTDARLRSVSG